MLSLGTSEACWLRYLLIDLKFDNKERPIKIYEDNLSTIKVCNNPEFYQRLKHIDIKVHFVRNKVKENIIQIEYLSTDKQIGDMFTKPLEKQAL